MLFDFIILGRFSRFYLLLRKPTIYYFYSKHFTNTFTTLNSTYREISTSLLNFTKTTSSHSLFPCKMWKRKSKKESRNYFLNFFLYNSLNLNYSTKLKFKTLTKYNSRLRKHFKNSLEIFPVSFIKIQNEKLKAIFVRKRNNLF